MKRMSLVIVTVVAMATAGLAQTDLDAVRDKMMHAGPVLRLKARQLVQQSYPELPLKFIEYLADRHPNLPTQVALARLETLRDKHPEAWTSLPARVLDDVHARHPHVVTRAMLAWWTTVGEKDPTALSRRLEARAHDWQTLIEKNPDLAIDILEVVKRSDPKLPATICKDAARVVYDTDPTLAVDLAIDVAAICRRHPNVRTHLAGHVGLARLQALRGAMAENPRFAMALWTMIDQKYADRLFTVTRNLVATIGLQHGSRLQALAIHVVTMIDRKHPSLPYEAARLAVASGRALAQAREAKAPGATADLAASLQAIGGSVMSDVIESIDRHSPTLRIDVRAAVQARFPGMWGEVAAFIKNECPDLIPRLIQL